MEDKATKYGYNVCMQMRQYIVNLQHVYLFITILRNTCFRHQRGFLFPYNCMNAFTEKGIREMIGNTSYPQKGSH